MAGARKNSQSVSSDLIEVNSVQNYEACNTNTRNPPELAHFFWINRWNSPSPILSNTVHAVSKFLSSYTFILTANSTISTLAMDANLEPWASRMDNLQRHYLIRFLAAQKQAMAGKVFECLEVCFELRLMPDLAMYTRALVCLTISDLAQIEEYPDKMVFAKEGLRIARELKTDANTEDSFRIGQYASLEEDALSCVTRVEDEEKEYSAMLEEEKEYAAMLEDGREIQEYVRPPKDLKDQEGLEDVMDSPVVTSPDTNKVASATDRMVGENMSVDEPSGNEREDDTDRTVSEDMSVNKLSGNNGDSELDVITDEPCCIDEVTGNKWYAVPDSDDEEIEEDMLQIEGLFTIRPRYKDEEEDSTSPKSSAAETSQGGVMETESEASGSDFKPALENLNLSEDSSDETSEVETSGLRQPPITEFFGRLKSGDVEMKD